MFTERIAGMLASIYHATQIASGPHPPLVEGIAAQASFGAAPFVPPAAITCHIQSFKKNQTEHPPKKKNLLQKIQKNAKQVTASLLWMKGFLHFVERGGNRLNAGSGTTEICSLSNCHVYMLTVNNMSTSTKLSRALLSGVPRALLSHIYWQRGSLPASAAVTQRAACCRSAPRPNGKPAQPATSQTFGHVLPTSSSLTQTSLSPSTSSSRIYCSSCLPNSMLPLQLVSFTQTQKCCFLLLFMYWFKVTFSFHVQWSHSDAHRVNSINPTCTQHVSREDNSLLHFL